MAAAESVRRRLPGRHALDPGASYSPGLQRSEQLDLVHTQPEEVSWGETSPSSSLTQTGELKGDL